MGTTVVFNAWTIVSARYEISPADTLGYSFVVLTFLYGTFYDPRSGLMAKYSTETFPYGLRAKSFNWLNFCVTGSFFSTSRSTSSWLDAIQWHTYIVYCVFLGFECWVIYTFLGETRYTPVEEIARYFDDKDAVDVADVAKADLKEQGLMATAEEAQQRPGRRSRGELRRVEYFA